MNKAILVGRLTRDPEMRRTNNSIPVASFTLAVDRRYKTSSGERETDFLPCVAWRSQAEFCGKYLRKGMRIVVAGSIQTRSWDDKDGNRRTTTEIICDEIEFAESKRQEAPVYVDSVDDDVSLPFDI